MAIINLENLTMNIPNEFKIKTPIEGSEQLDLMYDFLFNKIVSIGWAGRTGDYPFGNDHQIAKDQDGFIYCYIGSCGERIMSASVRSASIFVKNLKEVKEITFSEIEEIMSDN
jgi:hypothetical protein